MKLIKDIKYFIKDVWRLIKNDIIIKKDYYRYLPIDTRFFTLYASVIALFIFVIIIAELLGANGQAGTSLFPYSLSLYEILLYPVLFFLSFVILTIITIRFRDFFDESIFPLFYMLFLIIFVSFIPNHFFFRDYYLFSTSTKEKTVKELKTFLNKERKKHLEEVEDLSAIGKINIPNLMPYRYVFKPAELVEEEKKEIAKVKKTLFKKPEY